MSDRILEPDDVCRWTAPDSDDCGCEPFEWGPTVTPQASRGQIVMGQNGPVLEAASGNCLLVPVFLARGRIGLLIHLGRDESLGDADAAFVRKAFGKFPQLKESPRIGFISSAEIRAVYGRQIEQLQEVFRDCTHSPRFEEFQVGCAEDEEGAMSVEVYLDTGRAELTIEDDFAEPQVIRYGP